MRYTGVALCMAVALCVGCGEAEEDVPIQMILEVENISDVDTFKQSNGESLSLPLAPGFFALTTTPDQIYSSGAIASKPLETLAEVGNPTTLIDEVRAQSGTDTAGILGDINNPDYKESPVLPGQKATLLLTFQPGHKLVVASMLGVSNDTFLGTQAGGIDLDGIDPSTTVDVTSKFVWWDAGTEVNEPIGEGPNQVSNAPGTESGESEDGLVSIAPLDDGEGNILLPPVSKMVKVTLKPL